MDWDRWEIFTVAALLCWSFVYITIKSKEYYAETQKERI